MILDPFACEFAGVRLYALPDRALWWAEMRTLLVADLHLEKGSWYAASGQHLPPYDSIETLERLAALAARLDAGSIWCLGDNFHDPHGAERLPGAAKAVLETLAARHDLRFITGNHDQPKRDREQAAKPATCGLSAMAEAALGPFMLRHEADAATGMPELSGHWHPKIRLQTPARTLSRACFARIGPHLILPAFGAYTGGHFVHDAHFAPALKAAGHSVTALVPLGGRLATLPVARTHSRPAAMPHM